MKAKKIEGKTTGGERTLLSKLIPLKTPLLVQIFPFYGCNFKCSYCIHSVDESQRGFISNSKFLDFGTYKKFIDDLIEFEKPLKMLRFAGTGEPLLHNKIAEMISYAKQKHIANSIDIVTNAVYLTKELSDKLIKSGLSTLRISLQGLDEETYFNTCGEKIDYNEFVLNIKYFYDNKKDSTKVYIKIIDCALKRDEEELFYKIFGDICDYIAIEHVTPAVDRIDYSKIVTNSYNLTQNGNYVTDAKVCPQPFYMAQLNPDGNIVPCCNMETAFIIGNINNDSFYNIWNSDKYKNFRIKHLKFEKDYYSICSKCKQYKYSMFKEDYLDNHTEELIKKFNSIY